MLIGGRNYGNVPEDQTHISQKRMLKVNLYSFDLFEKNVFIEGSSQNIKKQIKILKNFKLKIIARDLNANCLFILKTEC